MFILAHGALGYWDEAIFMGIVVIFIGFMVMSYIKSRNTPPPFDSSSPPPTDSTQPDSPKRFELD